ncbi:MAG: class I SAM-dependent methyltransferase, partial [Lachnospiraceae bacterium]|nr:class I SAM-dependent methyltransferase [Lachnospiraceae bacterium]
NREAIIEYFDAHASHWDEGMFRVEKNISEILDLAGVAEGDKILDVACGTGVLIGDYLKRNAGMVVGVDFSPGMIEIANMKFSDPRVRFLNDDIENIGEGFKFDRAIVYNAFPHFINPREVIRKMVNCVRTGGTVTIAHGTSREDINACHNSLTECYARDLPPAVEVAKLFPENVEIENIIDGDFYLVSGRKII